MIDDEDKSLGNKLALNDDEFQKLLDIPGVFRASEAPQPPQRPDVQEIEAINRFMRDNPVEKAEGGKIGGGVIAGKNFGNRTGFANPVSPLSSPEVLKRIIELASSIILFNTSGLLRGETGLAKPVRFPKFLPAITPPPILPPSAFSTGLSRINLLIASIS